MYFEHFIANVIGEIVGINLIGQARSLSARKGWEQILSMNVSKEVDCSFAEMEGYQRAFS